MCFTVPNSRISGFEGSTAQSYATANTIGFEPIYKVSYNSNGGSAVGWNYAAMDGTVGAPAEPTCSGHVFGGWYLTPAFDTAPVTFPCTVKGTATLYAKWTPVYTVTLDSRGVSAVASQWVTSGGKAAKPVDPTFVGHVFGGWYTDSAFTRAWVFDTDTVTENITLYAKWTELKLASSDTDSKFYTNGRITLTPSAAGGTWTYGSAYLS